jgi:hypothetical protein
MTWTETPTQSPAETWEAFDEAGFESPFTPHESTLSFSSFSEALSPPLSFGTASPFADASGMGGGFSGREAALAELLDELFDPEMERALGEVVQEASGIHAEHSALTMGESASYANESVAQYLEPLAQQAEQLLEQFAATAGDREAGTLSEAEVNQLLESLDAIPLPNTESPAFENFFGALARVAKRAVSGAVSLAKKGISAVGRIIPLGAIFNKLKALIRPLLNKVLNFAINRLPVALRPIALNLKRRLFGMEAESIGQTEAPGVGEITGSTSESPAVGEIASLNEEWTAEVAQLLLAEGPTGESSESSELLAEWEDFSPASTGLAAGYEGESAANELDAARVRLISSLANLTEGESAAPAFEQFLPAVLPVLRLGIGVAGRHRVVGFLAKFLAKMLANYVGPQLSGPLSQAIVDAGLRLLTLEAPSAQEVQLAAPAAVAAVVEDTARRFFEAEDETYEDPARMEVEAGVAFNEAVAHNFPPGLLRADLDELEVASTGASAAMWALRPGVYSYKKYTKTFEITLTPQMARAIRTFGGVTLASFLTSRYGRLHPAKVKVYLYEALPGTYLSRISAREKHIPGMQPDGWRRFHPLTVQAAGTLLGEPGLGKDVGERFLRSRHKIAAGQRFYYLALPAPSGGGVAATRASQAFLTLDGRPTKNEIRLSVFLSEREAQEIATRARAGNTTAFVLALRAGMRAALTSLRSSPGSRVRILREANSLAELEDEGALAAVGSKLLEIVVEKLVDAVLRLATDYAKVKRDEFVKAVDNRKPGVTIIVTVPAPGLSTILRGGVLGSLSSVGSLRTILGTFTSAHLLPGVQTVPGLVRA